MLNYCYIILLSLLPSLFWIIVVACFVDRRKPEAGKNLLKVFLGGCFISLPIFILVEGARHVLNIFVLPEFFYILLLSFMVDGLIEELGKFFVLKEGVYSKVFFDEPIDGLVYGVTAAMGFAFVENILYLTFVKPELVVLRFVAPTLMHALATGIVGYHLALVKFKKVSLTKKRLYTISGILLAVVLHGLFNSVVRYNVFINYFPLAVLIILSYIYLLGGLRRAQKI